MPLVRESFGAAVSNGSVAVQQKALVQILLHGAAAFVPRTNDDRDQIERASIAPLFDRSSQTEMRDLIT